MFVAGSGDDGGGAELWGGEGEVLEGGEVGDGLEGVEVGDRVSG